MESNQCEQELFYHLALSTVPGVGPIVGKTLISYCGSAEAAFTASKKIIAKIPGVGPVCANALNHFKDFHLAESELKFVIANNIRAIHYTSQQYPMRLKQIMDSPLVLFSKGEADLNHDKFIGIVGTRKNTHYGAEMTRRIVEGLKPYNVHIISGLAFGIDITAHKACLDLDIPTLGVVGHGLDILYPGQHKTYARKMVEQGGAIISEFFSGTALNKDLFPRRNRIVAGLCDALVVVESMAKGGSMITSDIAFSYNKDVFAVPGKATDPMSEGCNFLVKNLKAAICENALDIANGMNWSLPNEHSEKKPIQAQLFLELNEDEKRIVTFLENGEKTYDDILISTQIPVSKLSFLLLNLEMKNMLHAMPGKKYAICR